MKSVSDAEPEDGYFGPAPRWDPALRDRRRLKVWIDMWLGTKDAAYFEGERLLAGRGFPSDRRHRRLLERRDHVALAILARLSAKQDSSRADNRATRRAVEFKRVFETTAQRDLSRVPPDQPPPPSLNTHTLISAPSAPPLALTG